MSLKKESEHERIFIAAYKQYKKDLDKRSSFKVNNQALSEDLVQDTFLKTWKYIVRGGKIEVMKAFLYHVLGTSIIDEYRKHKTASLDSLIEEGFEPEEIGDDSERAIDILDSKRAILMIARLPLKYQKIMRMRYVEDLSLQEMAKMTGQTKNTAAVQISRGLRKLKKMYDQENRSGQDIS